MPTQIPPEFEPFIESLIAQRRYFSAQEVLAEGLRLLKAKESLTDEVKHGFEQLDEGRHVDGPTAINSLRTRLLEREGT